MNISIVTGTLNRLPFLPGLINNCIRDERNELVLVDGGSTDGSIEYIRKRASGNERIKLIEMGRKSCYAEFMNLGIKSAKHEYVCQWNDDVLLVDDWAVVYDNLDNAHGLFIFPWKRGGRNHAADPSWMDLGVFNKEVSTNGWIRYPDCLNYGVYRKDVFRRVGLFSKRFKFYYADADLTRRAMSIGRFKAKKVDARVLDLLEPKKKPMANAEVDQHDGRLSREFTDGYSRGILPEGVEYL